MTITNVSEDNSSNSSSSKSSKKTGFKAALNIRPTIRSSTSTSGGSVETTRKVTSFVMPKRSYDFDKFADETTAKRLAGAKSALSEPNFNLDPIGNEESTTGQQTGESTTAGQVSRSQADIKATTDMSSSAGSTQRKRSYDIHPPASGHGATETAINLPRRHSMAKVHQQGVEAPIRKVINIICLAQENSGTDLVRKDLEKALEILRSTELYNPALIENDKHTSDLVSGLMSVSGQSLTKALLYYFRFKNIYLFIYLL